jgi:hypothetical protein
MIPFDNYGVVRFCEDYVVQSDFDHVGRSCGFVPLLPRRCSFIPFSRCLVTQSMTNETVHKLVTSHVLLYDRWVSRFAPSQPSPIYWTGDDTKLQMDAISLYLNTAYRHPQLAQGWVSRLLHHLCQFFSDLNHCLTLHNPSTHRHIAHPCLQLVGHSRVTCISTID